MTVVRQVVGLNNAPNVIDYQSGGCNSRHRHQLIHISKEKGLSTHITSYHLNSDKGLIEHLDENKVVVNTHKPSESELWAFKKISSANGELENLFDEVESTKVGSSSVSVYEVIASALFVMLLCFLFWGEPDVWGSLQTYFLNL